MRLHRLNGCDVRPDHFLHRLVRRRHTIEPMSQFQQTFKIPRYWWRCGNVGQGCPEASTPSQLARFESSNHLRVNHLLRSTRPTSSVIAQVMECKSVGSPQAFAKSS